MNEDIIKWAREVDPVTKLLIDKKLPQRMDHDVFMWFLARFAALVRADEREACAKVCDARCIADGWEGFYADECAAAIRERSQE
jgi:hypothetical protein